VVVVAPDARGRRARKDQRARRRGWARGPSAAQLGSERDRLGARVNNPKNTWLFTQDWGIDTAVSAPELLTHLLDAGMGVQDVVTMLRTERGGIALVEVTLNEDAPAVGHRVAELPLPEGSAVVAVVRDEEVLPGGGPTPLAPGDEVLAVTMLAVEPTLRRVLGGLSGGSHTPVG
jgi:trk system potassium uptake protein TrkA